MAVNSYNLLGYDTRDTKPLISQRKTLINFQTTLRAFILYMRTKIAANLY